MSKFIITCFSILLLGCSGNAQKNTKKEEKTYPVTKTTAEWKEILTNDYWL